jgi:hypothetical protein
MLGLSEQQVIDTTDKLFDKADDLEDLARRLAA